MPSLMLGIVRDTGLPHTAPPETSAQKGNREKLQRAMESRKVDYRELGSYHATLGLIRRSLGAVSKVFPPYEGEAYATPEGMAAVAKEFQQLVDKRAIYPDFPVSEKWAKASTFIVLVGGMLTAGVTQVRLRESAPPWSRMETLTTSHRISHRRALGRDGALQERRRSPPGQSGVQATAVRTTVPTVHSLGRRTGVA